MLNYLIILKKLLALLIQKTTFNAFVGKLNELTESNKIDVIYIIMCKLKRKSMNFVHKLKNIKHIRAKLCIETFNEYTVKR